MTATSRRGFRAWAASAALSSLGNEITLFAVAWVAASDGPRAASVVLTAGAIPLCAVLPFGGLAGDRCGVRLVMVVCDIVMAAVTGTLALGALWAVPLWSLAAVSFVGGSAAALRRPAAAVFPRLFARGDELSRRMATVTLLQQLAKCPGQRHRGPHRGRGLPSPPPWTRSP